MCWHCWLTLISISFCLYKLCQFILSLDPIIFNFMYPIENQSPATCLKFVVNYRNFWNDFEMKLSSQNEANYKEKLQIHFENQKMLELEFETFSEKFNNITLYANGINDPKELSKLSIRLLNELDYFNETFSRLILNLHKSLREEENIFIEVLDQFIEASSPFTSSRFRQHLRLLSGYGYDLHSTEIDFSKSQNIDAKISEVLGKFLSFMQDEEKIQNRISLLSDKLLTDKEQEEVQELELRSKDYKSTIRNFYNQNKYILSCTYSNVVHANVRVFAYKNKLLKHSLEMRKFMVDILTKFRAVATAAKNDCATLPSKFKANVNANYHQEL